MAVLANVMKQADAIVEGLQAIDRVSNAVAETLNMGEKGEQDEEGGKSSTPDDDDGKGTKCKDPNCKKSKSTNFFKSNYKEIVGCFMAVALVLSSLLGATTAMGSIARGHPNVTCLLLPPEV